MPSSSSVGITSASGLPPPQRVFALERGDRLDRVGAADRLHARFGKAEVLDLALPESGPSPLPPRLRSARPGRRGADRTDRWRSTLSRLSERLGDLLDVLRPAVQARPPCARRLRTSNPNLVAITTCSRNGASASPTSFFVRERAVDLGGVEERDAAFDGRPDQRDHLLLVRRRAVAEKLIPMQPRPRAETSRLLFPSFRFCIRSLSERPPGVHGRCRSHSE